MHEFCESYRREGSTSYKQLKKLEGSASVGIKVYHDSRPVGFEDTRLITCLSTLKFIPSIISGWVNAHLKTGCRVVSGTAKSNSSSLVVVGQATIGQNNQNQNNHAGVDNLMDVLLFEFLGCVDLVMTSCFSGENNISASNVPSGRYGLLCLDPECITQFLPWSRKIYLITTETGACITLRYSITDYFYSKEQASPLCAADCEPLLHAIEVSIL